MAAWGHGLILIWGDLKGDLLKTYISLSAKVDLYIIRANAFKFPFDQFKHFYPSLKLKTDLNVCMCTSLSLKISMGLFLFLSGLH